MGRIWPVFTWCAGGVGFLVVAGLALVYANDWWLSGVMTGSILAWLGGLLSAIYSHPRRRAMLVGALTASFLYVLLALGPWFRIHVGPWLLTSQALVHIETEWLGHEPQQQFAITAIPNLPWSYVDAGAVLSGGQYLSPGTTLSMIGSTAPQAGRPLVHVGHWLCGWLAAGLGILAPAWVIRRRAKPNLSCGTEVKS
jgi:hypothetical protein